MTAFVCTLTTLVVFLAGARVLCVPRSAPLTTRRALRALAVGAGLAFAQGVVCFAVRRSPFLSINVAYCALMIAAPLAGALVLALSARREVHRGAVGLALLTFALPPIGWHATFVAPWQLVTERSTAALPPERALPRPITIAVLSDIQTAEVSDHEREAVRRALDAQPDLILLPGDLIQIDDDELPAMVAAFHELVGPLHAPLGVYAVVGNCESLDTARQLLDGTPVRLLSNEIVVAEHEGARVRVCGVGLRPGAADVRAIVREFEALAGEDDVRIVLAHLPDVLRELAPHTRVDLIVAGHTHGGQVSLPLIGPPIVLTGAPRAIAAGGLHELDGRRIYVSRGIGWEHAGAPRVRFRCPPEVSLITLRRR